MQNLKVHTSGVSCILAPGCGATPRCTTCYVVSEMLTLRPSTDSSPLMMHSFKPVPRTMASYDESIVNDDGKVDSFKSGWALYFRSSRR